MAVGMEWREQIAGIIAETERNQRATNKVGLVVCDTDTSCSAYGRARFAEGFNNYGNPLRVLAHLFVRLRVSS